MFLYSSDIFSKEKIIYGLCKRKVKKLKRKGLLVHTGIPLHFRRDRGYFDVSSKYSIKKYENYALCFNCSVKGRRYGVPPGNTLVAYYDDFHYLYKEREDLGFYIITKSKSEATKLKLIL